MKRAVVCVATTPHYRGGLSRLAGTIEPVVRFCGHADTPVDWPTHEQVQYGFKAYALKEAMDLGADLLLWCDASILPVRSLEPLWQRIEQEGYWFSRNGWTNYEWTADSAYPDLFGGWYTPLPGYSQYEGAAETNRTIEHVVADVLRPKRKASQRESFLG